MSSWCGRILFDKLGNHRPFVGTGWPNFEVNLSWQNYDVPFFNNYFLQEL
jgi:hypothetical protein